MYLAASVRCISKEEEISRLLGNISEQATRHLRATDDESFLKHDLAFIAEKVEELKQVIKSDRDSYCA